MNDATSTLNDSRVVVLLVDDEPIVLRLCQQILNLGGYRVIQATSGQEALRLLQQNDVEIGLALLDIMMPGMNGIELGEQIQRRRPSTPIVLMTGYGPREIAQVIGDKNPYRIIWKPFKTESLLRMIENVLSVSAGASA
jgi:DNA-binding NtrC family response regulator